MERSHSPLGVALQVVGLLLLLAILAGVLLVVFAIASLTSVPGSVGGQVGGLATEAGRTLTGAQQALQRATDRNPPPLGLAYDTELTALHTWRIGDQLPGGSAYVLSVEGVRRRDGAESTDTALFAVIAAELRQPRETRLFGQVLRSDEDRREHIVYKGETFRIGRALYRVNWVSQQDAGLAAGTLRHPDALSAPLKFEYE
jgi:hypothetical protein